jgi:hypothetical protein
MVAWSGATWQGPGKWISNQQRARQNLPRRAHRLGKSSVANRRGKAVEIGAAQPRINSLGEMAVIFLSD